MRMDTYTYIQLCMCLLEASVTDLEFIIMLLFHFSHPRSRPPMTFLDWTQPLAANSQRQQQLHQLQRHNNRPHHSTPGPRPPSPPAMEEYHRHSPSQRLLATTPSSHKLRPWPLLRLVVHHQIHGELRVKVQVMVK